MTNLFFSFLNVPLIEPLLWVLRAKRAAPILLGLLLRLLLNLKLLRPLTQIAPKPIIPQTSFA